MSIEAMKQEPVAFASHGVVNWIADRQFQHEADLYTHPQPKAEQEPVIDKSAAIRIATALGWEPKRERNFCERCGKRLFDGIHTCTPPAEQLKRKWVGLTDEEIADLMDVVDHYNFPEDRKSTRLNSSHT